MKSLRYKLILIFFFSHFMLIAEFASAENEICKIILNHGASEIYVAGNSVGRVRIMTEAEYKHAALNDDLSVTDFIVVDRFPTELDPQAVAGVMSGAKIPHGTHMEFLAEKMKIPFGYSEGIHQDADWIMLASQPDELHFLSLTNETHQIQKNLSPIQVQTLKKPAEKIFQEQPDHDFTEINEAYKIPINADRNVSITQYGEKVVGQSEGMHAIPMFRYHWFPKSAGVPFGIYYQYLTHTRLADGLTLEESIFKKMSELENGNLTSSQVSDQLGIIQNWFDQYEIPSSIIDHVYDRLFKIFGNLNVRIRIRDSSDIADELGGGVYLSAIFDGTQAKTIADIKTELSKTIRKVYQSLYTYRAFQIRKFYGVDEKKVAMALLIHPSIDNEVASGVSTVLDYYGDIESDHIVYPKGYSATSPSIDSPNLYFQLEEKKNHDLLYSLNRKNYLPFNHQFSNKILPHQAINELFKAEKYIIEDIKTKFVNHYKLSFEWLMVEGDTEEGKGFVPVIVQVKHLPVSVLPPPPSGLSHFLHPSVVENYQPTAQAEIEKLNLTHSTCVSPTEYIMRNYNHFEMFTGVPYYYIEINGTRYLFFGWSHGNDIHNFEEDFKMNHFKYEYLEIGNFSFNVKREGNKILLENLILMESGTSKANDLLAKKEKETNPALMREIINHIISPGFIEFGNHADISTTETNGRFNRMLGGASSDPDHVRYYIRDFMLTK